MTVVDLHPEELLEKERAGGLEASERARLDAHLARCAVCRMERQLHADFAEDLASEASLERALGLGLESLTASISGIATEIDERKLVPEPPPSQVALKAGARGPRRSKARVAWLLAAATLLMGGAAAAAMGLGPVAWLRPVPAVAEQSVRPIGDVPAHAPRVAAAPVVPPVEATPPVPAPAAPTSPRVSVASTQLPSAHPMAVVGHVVGPANLFENESEARRHGDYGRALDLDGTLEGRYPTSREAQASRAIVGRLLLDRGDPQAALAKFDAYLAAGSGQLGEEAMIGRATALDRLGRNDEAVRAWSALLAAFPETPFASHARTRLESSNGR